MPHKRKDANLSPSKVKRLKTEKLNQQLLEVENALEKASLTSEVKEMVSSVMPFCLGEFNDQRHDFQHRMVEGIASCMREAEDILQRRVNEKQTERDRLAGEKPLRDSEAEEAAEKLATQTSEVHRLKVALAQKAIAFRVARSALHEAENAKVSDGLKGKDAEKKKVEYEAAVENLTVVKTALPENADAQKRLRNLMEMSKKCKFEQSMQIALISALGKAPDARGRFDLIAISQLGSKIDEMLGEQTAILANAALSQAKCDATIQEAEGSFSAAEDDQAAAAKVFELASEELTTCEATHKSAQKAAREHAQSLSRLERTLESEEAELEIFQQGPLETFKELCDQVTPAGVEEVTAAVCMENADAAVALEEPAAIASEEGDSKIAGIPADRLKAELQRVVARLDISTATVGQVRGKLESSLGLEPGTLTSSKRVRRCVGTVLQEEVAKKAQRTPDCERIVRALAECHDYPDYCRQMLVEGLPMALTSKRVGALHPHQVRLLEMARDAISDARSLAFQTEKQSEESAAASEEVLKSLQVACDAATVAHAKVTEEMDTLTGREESSTKQLDEAKDHVSRLKDSIQQAPLCPACNQSTKWDSCREGDYSEGWACDNHATCGNDGEAGSWRWCCARCVHDLCDTCGLAAAEQAVDKVSELEDRLAAALRVQRLHLQPLLRGTLQSPDLRDQAVSELGAFLKDELEKECGLAVAMGDALICQPADRSCFFTSVTEAVSAAVSRKISGIEEQIRATRQAQEEFHRAEAVYEAAVANATSDMIATADKRKILNAACAACKTQRARVEQQAADMDRHLAKQATANEMISEFAEVLAMIERLIIGDGSFDGVADVSPKDAAAETLTDSAASQTISATAGA